MSTRLVSASGSSLHTRSNSLASSARRPRSSWRTREKMTLESRTTRGVAAGLMLIRRGRRVRRVGRRTRRLCVRLVRGAPRRRPRTRAGSSSTSRSCSSVDVSSSSWPRVVTLTVFTRGTTANLSYMHFRPCARGRSSEASTPRHAGPARAPAVERRTRHRARPITADRPPGAAQAQAARPRADERYGRPARRIARPAGQATLTDAGISRHREQSPYSRSPMSCSTSTRRSRCCWRSSLRRG